VPFARPALCDAILVAIVGVSALAVDASRYMSLQTQLQNGADALALAGAVEATRIRLC